MAGEEELTVGHAGLEVWNIRRCPPRRYGCLEGKLAWRERPRVSQLGEGTFPRQQEPGVENSMTVSHPGRAFSAWISSGS